ncbi:hypothetical protein BGM26_06670 [Bacillus sp. FJAT-29790]|uniref:hypothetical protein n=1 Tax=Bacillus sp. FJAT-29790 TaxID=1895002 RepID=UPI001C220EFD|nr:hypothetical protein [Bacillus sp. FJAT-29790]MBU8878672.1 hypothetical protein [Bacillus sp. FJAT-29790]
MFKKRHFMLIILFFSYSLLAFYIHDLLRAILNDQFRVYPYVFLIGFTYIPLGVILGSLNNLNEGRKPGKWSFHTVYFLSICLPSLYLLFYAWIHFQPFISLPMVIGSAILSAKPYPIFGLTFGYGIMTSFYKKV